jgi:hypothetical protein
MEGASGEGAVVGVVDAGRTLDAGFGSGLDGVWVARAPEGGRSGEGAWAAEALLRSGAFDLLVLDGCVPEAAQAHRLRALAREQEVAVVVSVDGGAGGMLGWRADLRLEFGRAGGVGLAPGGRFRGRARMRGERVDGREKEVDLVHEPTDRLYPGAPSVDRRPRQR